MPQPLRYWRCYAVPDEPEPVRICHVDALAVLADAVLGPAIGPAHESLALGDGEPSNACAGPTHHIEVENRLVL